MELKIAGGKPGSLPLIFSIRRFSKNLADGSWREMSGGKNRQYAFRGERGKQGSLADVRRQIKRGSLPHFFATADHRVTKQRLILRARACVRQPTDRRKPESRSKKNPNVYR